MATPPKVTMLDLRERAEEIIRAVQRGKRMVLTYRGRPVMRLEPLSPDAAQEDDAFYRLADLAAPGGRSLDNEDIDALVYGT